MQIQYENTKIKLHPDAEAGLKTFARHVMIAMQKAEPDFKECWTSCGIRFDGILPEFEWGDIKDVRPEDFDLHVGA